MKRVVAFGTFDPLHEGHKDFLKQAKKLGYLVVVVSSDDKIRFEKGREPRAEATQRVKDIKNLGIADEVLISEEGKKYNLVEILEPDIIVLGYDQKIPEPLKNKVKKYKIVSLKPFMSDIYKSSKITKDID